MNRAITLSEKALIVGCGDIGQRVARRLLECGVEVSGVVSSEPGAIRLAGHGVPALAYDLDRPATPPQAPLLFWFAPPPKAGLSDPRLRNWLAAARGIERIVYISTSGVYGDCEGRWIDEDEPFKPQTDRARRRVDAENALAEWRARGGETVVLRVPGIYGPGRLPERRLRQGLPVIDPAESPYSNRIHSEDLATAACAAAQCGIDGAAYNIADGRPSPMADYFLRCATRLGLPPPPIVPMAQARRALTPAMLSFLEESKRLRIDRMREQLGVVLRYPSLHEGLAHCV